MRASHTHTHTHTHTYARVKRPRASFPHLLAGNTHSISCGISVLRARLFFPRGFSARVSERGGRDGAVHRARVKVLPHPRLRVRVVVPGARPGLESKKKSHLCAENGGFPWCPKTRFCCGFVAAHRDRFVQRVRARVCPFQSEVPRKRGSGSHALGAF